jgi:type VI protein secretion system component VasK
MNEIITLTNHAALQSDRWLFVALLVIGLLAIGVLFRYFTARLDALQTRMDSQTAEFVAHLKTANQEMLEVIASAKAVIERVERKLEGL